MYQDLYVVSRGQARHLDGLRYAGPLLGELESCSRDVTGRRGSSCRAHQFFPELSTFAVAIAAIANPTRPANLLMTTSTHATW